MEWSNIIVLCSSFLVLLFIGAPISFSIGIASLLTIMLSIPFDAAIAVISQKMASGLDSFSLLAIPFFILAGNIMNRGGIAIRLIEFAKVIGGRLPGSLAHVNVLANMMFGSISGSAVASGAAMGGIMSPLQTKVNISSCPTGLLIPPSNTFIVYSLISGGTSIGALFLAGYIPGILMGLSIMVIVAIIAKKRKYPVSPKPTRSEAMKKTLDALPSLGLIIVIMGGIIGGIFTATEASAFAVVYTLILAVVFYREVTIKELPKIILDSVVTTAIVLLLIGTSMGMSWAMANADIPYTISDALLNISDNPIVILLIINIILLIVGVFMDMTPALLIFTPIFLPIVTELGMDPVHFGVLMAFNLSIGICTPPVGSALFIGCSVGGVKINQVIKPLLPFYFALILTLLLVTYVPSLSLALPQMLLGY